MSEKQGNKEPNNGFDSQLAKQQQIREEELIRRQSEIDKLEKSLDLREE